MHKHFKTIDANTSLAQAVQRVWRTVGHTCGSVFWLTGSELVAVLVLAGLDSGSLFGSSNIWETDDPMVAASTNVWQQKCTRVYYQEAEML